MVGAERAVAVKARIEAMVEARILIGFWSWSWLVKKDVIKSGWRLRIGKLRVIKLS